MSDLKIVRGDTNVLNVTVLRQNAAVPLTGAILWFTVKNQISDPDADAVFQKTTADGISIPSPANGKAIITVTPADTANITEERTCFYDVQLKEQSGAITTVAEGKIKIVEDVTLATTIP